MINNLFISKFFKDITKFLAVHISPTFLNSGATDKTFQQSGKQDSFKDIWKRSASMYESSGSEFFNTTTGIQSGPDVFHETRFVMAFLPILGVWELQKYHTVSD